MDYRKKIGKRDCLLMALIYTIAAGIWWYVTFRIYQNPEAYSSIVRTGSTTLGVLSVMAGGLNWYRWFMYDRAR